MKVKKVLDIKTHYSFEAPLFRASIPTGATHVLSEDFASLDLNRYLLRKPESTFFVRVRGESMIDRGIFDGDILVVDKSLTPQQDNVVVAGVDGEMAVKTLKIIDGQPYLYSANKQYLPIEIKPYMQFEIFGVVEFVIHRL
jgi:DNA polymerase V